MAFNFSKIDLSQCAAQHNAARRAESQAGPAASARSEARRPCFEIPECSLAR
jgi:hypothetical protein